MLCLASRFGYTAVSILGLPNGIAAGMGRSERFPACLRKDGRRLTISILLTAIVKKIFEALPCRCAASMESDMEEGEGHSAAGDRTRAWKQIRPTGRHHRRLGVGFFHGVSSGPGGLLCASPGAVRAA